jgi:hypothetical protein
MRKEATDPLCVEPGSAKAGAIAGEKPGATTSATANSVEVSLLKLDMLIFLPIPGRTDELSWQLTRTHDSKSAACELSRGASVLAGNRRDRT